MSESPIAVALADDLTGALEVGARFAGSVVTVEQAPEAWPRTGGVIVVDTESRAMAEPEAARAVERAAVGARRLGVRFLYQKTDSTLRGNLAAEMGALVGAWPERPLVYVPAYPAMGRTVRAGRLLVDGRPLEETAFARDPSHPARTGEIAARLGGLPVRVVDGETDDDVRAAAREIAACHPMPLVAGPAAIAGALAEVLGLVRAAPAEWPRLGRALVVNGSLHPASRAQVERLRTGADAWRIFDPAGRVGEALGQAVREEVERAAVDGLVVCGGDTARAIHRALGGGDFEPLGEVVPGVPVSRCRGRWWVTKAGGFGAPGILCDIQERLR